MKRRLTRGCRIVAGVAMLCSIMVAICVSGCGKASKSQSDDAKVPAGHEHHAPHGGTPVVLGQEEYHVEFVLDAARSKLLAYVMDGELENFVRVAASSFDVVALVDGSEETLTFRAVPSHATGETVGDTSLFEATATWLKTNLAFEGVVADLTVRSNNYSRVTFNFPKGNDPDAKPTK